MAEELERIEDFGRLTIIPDHIEIRTWGIKIGRGTEDERLLPTQQVLRCTGCDTDTTLRYKWSDDPRLQTTYDDNLARQIVGFVSEHPSKDHRMHRGHPRKPL